jgi:hypothetical protein
MQLQREEQRVEGSLQWIQKDAEDQAAANEHNEDHSEHANAVVDPKRVVGQKMPQNMTAIERWNGNEVEHKEQEIQKDDVVEKQSNGEKLRKIFRRDPRNTARKKHGGLDSYIAASDGVLEDDEQDKRYGGRDQVARRPSQGDENVIALVILEVAGGYGSRLRPAEEHTAVEETDQWKDDRTERIEMFDGVQRESAEHLCSGVAKTPCSPGVGTLMDTKGEDENHNLKDNEDDLLIHSVKSTG